MSKFERDYQYLTQRAPQDVNILPDPCAYAKRVLGNYRLKASLEEAVGRFDVVDIAGGMMTLTKLACNRLADSTNGSDCVDELMREVAQTERKTKVRGTFDLAPNVGEVIDQTPLLATNVGLYLARFEHDRAEYGDDLNEADADRKVREAVMEMMDLGQKTAVIAMAIDRGLDGVDGLIKLKQAATVKRLMDILLRIAGKADPRTPVYQIAHDDSYRQAHLGELGWLMGIVLLGVNSGMVDYRDLEEFWREFATCNLSIGKVDRHTLKEIEAEVSKYTEISKAVMAALEEHGVDIENLSNVIMVPMGAADEDDDADDDDDDDDVPDTDLPHWTKGGPQRVM